jgi:DNA invertase Pin-like site-specific DNA recombinase
MENLQQKPRVVLLYRASSKQQTDSENDIPLQRNILKPWAEQKGYEFVREFVEGGISGFKVSASKRDAIIEIKAMAERKEFDVLGIYMSDRLGRIAEETPLIISFLNARGIRVVSYCEGEINSSTHADKLLTYIRYWQAEGESIKTSARVCDAVLENVNNGRWRGGMPPYGYRSVSRGTLNYKGKPILDVEIDPVTSEHVKTMFELYTKEHYGTRSIAKYLNDRDIPTPRGTMWNSSLVCKVLRCKTYIGIYELHKQTKNKPLIESPVMPHLVILDKPTWHRAQDLLQKNSTGPRRPPIWRGSLLLTTRRKRRRSLGM